jgi:hypothetical protein
MSEKKIDENGEISWGCMNGCSVVGLTGGLLLALAVKLGSSSISGRKARR